MNKIYILILNWNGWKDTIECLETVFRNDHPNYQVIVCDNQSQDDSLDYIKAWAEGRLETLMWESEELRYLTFPPVAKPIHYIEYDRKNAEAGGNSQDENVPLILIQNGANLGFAGGNNVGLRYILARNDFAYVWLLNNDTLIKTDALTKMIQRIKEIPEAGICGSTLLYYHQPDKVQAYGGARYNKWIGLAKHIGALENLKDFIDVHDIESRMNYVVGASMLVSRSFLNDVGLLSEDYFLYCEEVDWSTRAGNRYLLLYEPSSVVYHKEGATIGGSHIRSKEKSYIAEYHAVKSRLVYTRKFFPWCLPTLYLGFLVRMINYILRGQFKRVNMLFKIVLSKE
ncbi:glycosyltransferase family 2 protein [Effusibacillus consociatus]|uniref:Glycosyltransferase family 2 protein n=1 Tax=Effusibacillus consociatus TaxID=1117041 RepID=A0ABV9Q778_9BACL